MQWPGTWRGDGQGQPRAWGGSELRTKGGGAGPWSRTVCPQGLQGWGLQGWGSRAGACGAGAVGLGAVGLGLQGWGLQGWGCRAGVCKVGAAGLGDAGLGLLGWGLQGWGSRPWPDHPERSRGEPDAAHTRPGPSPPRWAWAPTEAHHLGVETALEAGVQLEGVTPLCL